MLYTKKSFSVPASAGTAAECARVGHTQPDGRGKCYRCAEKVIVECALEGGPFDGEVIPAPELEPVARTNRVTRNGLVAHYMAIGDPNERPRRFTHDISAKGPPLSA